MHDISAQLEKFCTAIMTDVVAVVYLFCFETPQNATVSKIFPNSLMGKSVVQIAENDFTLFK